MKHIEERKKKIASLLAGEGYTPMNFEELCDVLDVHSSDEEEFGRLIGTMESAGVIRKDARGRYELAEGSSVIKGRIQGTAGRFYFLIPDDKGKDDVFIPAENMNGAMHGDSVLLKLVPGRKGDNRSRGKVIQVLNIRRDEIIGVYESKPGPGIKPYDKRISRVELEGGHAKKMSDGDVVAVEITHPPMEGRPARGRITEVIAEKSDPKSYYKYLLRTYGYEETYPSEAIGEARRNSKGIGREEYSRRTDYRKLTTVTIDGADAKDLDDAISIEKKPDGSYRLWVHIADVSHYVEEGSELDKEAADRGTSVYLVDKVIPMLPEILSNNLCSLNPGEDKLAFSVMMDVDNQGTVTGYEINESVIKSDERMTYDDVHELLKDGNSPLFERYGELVPVFRTMRELAGILSKKRRSRGAVDFDFDESKVILGENGYPEEISMYDRTEAHRIIEEFMILCNETVAESFDNVDFPFVYRIHEKPDSDKLKELDTFLKTLGYGIRNPGKIHPAVFQELLDKVKGKPVEHLVSTVVLRSMQKAVYSIENLGHFGLASEHYCHFTSPIRRYPDLMVHRLIKKHKSGSNTGKREIKILEARTRSIADSSSEMERKAEQAERDLVDYYKAAYMQRHIGDKFEGVVSGVAGFGMFVELDNTVEGLVRVDSMDGYYIHDKERHALYNRNGSGRYTIGKKVKVKVVSVNIDMGEIDMVIDEGRKKRSQSYRKGDSRKKGGRYKKRRR